MYKWPFTHISPFVSPGVAAFAQQDQHINEILLNFSCVLRGKVRDVNDMSYYASFRYLRQQNSSKQSSDQEACGFIY